MSTSSSHAVRDRLPTYVPNADWHSDYTKASFASAATYHHLNKLPQLYAQLFFFEDGFFYPTFKRTMMTLTLRSTCVAGFVCAGIG